MTELDPLGKNQHEPGAKLDAGKLRPDLVLSGFAPALALIAAVGSYGAAKYTPNGWKEVPDAEERYREAAARHKLKMDLGEEVDPDTQLLHEGHYAWNVLASLSKKLVNAGQANTDWTKVMTMPPRKAEQAAEPAAEKPWYPDGRAWVEVADDVTLSPVHDDVLVEILCREERDAHKYTKRQKRANGFNWDRPACGSDRIVAYLVVS